MCLGSREPKEHYENVLEKKKKIPGTTDRPKPVEGPLKWKRSISLPHINLTRLHDSSNIGTGS